MRQFPPSVLIFGLLLVFVHWVHASRCLTVLPGAGCQVPGSIGVCTITPAVGQWTDCSSVCSTGDQGCYYRSPSDQGTSCSPSISCYSVQTCNCLPGGACAADDDCLGANQVCDALGTHTCIAKNTTLVLPVPFVKHGDNGVVNCNTFCAGSLWGRVGQCVAAQISAVPCDKTVGFLKGYEDSCTCQNALGQQFIKGGNNGTVSCNTFCAGSLWGPTGTCTASVVGQIPACDLLPGFLNGAELTCYCQ